MAKPAVICFITAFAVAAGLGPCDTTTLAPYVPPSPPTATTTPPCAPVTVNPAVIWGPILGVASAAAIGGTVAGVLASKQKGTTFPPPVLATKQPPPTKGPPKKAPPLKGQPGIKSQGLVKFRKDVDDGDDGGGGAVQFRSDTGDKGDEGSNPHSSGNLFAVIAGIVALLLLACCCAYFCCKKKKKKSRKLKKTVAPASVVENVMPMEVAPLLPAIAPAPMRGFPGYATAPVVETVAAPAPTYTYAPAPAVETVAAPTYTYATAAPMFEYAAPTTYAAAPTVL